MVQMRLCAKQTMELHRHGIQHIPPSHLKRCTWSSEMLVTMGWIRQGRVVVKHVLIRHQIFARSAGRSSVFPKTGYGLPCSDVVGAYRICQKIFILAHLYLEYVPFRLRSCLHPILPLTMKMTRVFHIGAFSSLNIWITTAAAAVSQQPTSLAIGLAANSTAPSLPAKSVNL